MGVLDITVQGRVYTVQWWQPGMMFPNAARYAAFDIETEKLDPAEPIRPVLMQICFPENNLVYLVHWTYMKETFRMLLRLPHCVSAYYTPFDLFALGVQFDDEVADAIFDGKLVDLSIRYILNQSSLGEYSEVYNLAYVCRRILGIQLSKDEDIRLTFKRDEGLSREHIEYAVMDSIATALLLMNGLPNPEPTEPLQILGYIGMYAVHMNGLLVDPDEVEKIRKEHEAKMEEAERKLSYFGWVPDQKGHQLQLQEVLERLERFCGITFPRSPHGKIKTNKELVAAFDSLGKPHPFAELYRERAHYQYTLGNVLSNKFLHADGRIHPTLHPMRRTGRAQFSSPNPQNIPRSGNLRAIYRAPDGHVLLAADASQIELCALAQHCLTHFGYSRMAELINNGEDLHTAFGKVLIKYAGLNPETVDESTLKKFRQRAKVANFGFPGGLGVSSFLSYARLTWDLRFTEGEVKEMRELWLEMFPEMRYHLQPTPDAEWTRKQIHRWIIENRAKYNLPHNWFPETLEELQSVLPQDDLWYELKHLQRYMVRLVSGRIVRNLTYTQACNYAFQGVTADAMKPVSYFVGKAGYRLVNFIHDEILVEMYYNPETINREVDYVTGLMQSIVQDFFPNVRIKIEPAIMTRWYKNAELVAAPDGTYIPWTPDQQEVA